MNERAEKAIPYTGLAEHRGRAVPPSDSIRAPADHHLMHRRRVNRMIVREIAAKSILSKSQIQDYALNPYVGCSHSCRYCYAAFMRRFTGHRERWGEFVDIKVNAPELLAKEIKTKRVGRVWVSGVSDPYQPAEDRHRVTARCLEILLQHQWPVTIQTKSSLILRDLTVLKKFNEIEVGFSITTADERIRRIFEPGASPVAERLRALGAVHAAGIPTFAMIAPMLPGCEGLVERLSGKADHVLVDRLNYSYANRVYLNSGMAWAQEAPFFLRTAEELREGFGRRGVPVRVLF